MEHFQQAISKQIWKDTYKWETDKTFEDTCIRVAKGVASIEQDKKFWENKYFDLLFNKRYVPAGRIWSNAGTGLKKTTFINCFVSGFDGINQDSIEGIYDEIKRQAKILSSEGGYGINFSVLRPKGGFVSGIGVETSGVLEFMKIWDMSSFVLTKGSNVRKNKNKGKAKIRKGAQMAMLYVWHPSIEEFITIKQQPGVLAHFNLTVLLTDEFMDAVNKRLPWNLEFPDTTYSEYDAEWDGDLRKWKEKNYPTILWKTYDDANELFNLIITSTYNRNEPGIAFIDRVNEMNNLSYCEKIHASNPCVVGETLVNTPYGLKKAKDLKEGDFISTLHWSGKEQIKKIEVNENYQTYKVSFSDGGFQYVTEGHVYHIVGDRNKKHPYKFIDRKALKDIKIGDKVQVNPTNISMEGLDRDSEKYKKALLVGIILGDGTITDHVETHNILKIASNQNHKKYNINVKKIINELGYPINADDNSKKSLSMNMNLSNGKKILKDLHLESGAYSYNKSIPDFYFIGVNNIVGVLEGLLVSDGNINLKSNHPQIRFKTCSDVMAQQIKSLLSLIGSHAFISNTFNQDGGTIDDRVIKRKNSINEITLSGNSIKEFTKYIYTCILPEKAEALKKVRYMCHLSGNSLVAEIQNIETYNKETVYDFYCEESDTWITSGYVQQGCGEQFLPVNGSCNLGSINLTKYVDIDNKKWDYELLKHDIPIIVRFQDAINDITNFPLKEQKKEALDKRRIGIGYMGYGSALYLLEQKYGEQQSLKDTEKLLSFIVNAIYSASSDIAVEKGVFPLYDKIKYINSKFIQTALTSTTVEKIKKQGLRNSHCTTVAPTGNTSLFSDVVSGGLEPVVSISYIRTVTVTEIPEGLITPTTIDWDMHTYEVSNGWEWKTEGDEYILIKKFRDTTYKIDRTRGVTKEELVYDYGALNKKNFNENAAYAVTLFDLTVKDHINVMKVFQKYVDASISKTINVPEDYSFENFKSVYMDAYKSKCIKGITTYRWGTMAEVISVQKDVEKNVVLRSAPERPKTLPCHIYRLTVKGEKWIVFVGLHEGHPYEVFAGRVNMVDLPASIDEGFLLKISKGKYAFELDGDLILKDISHIFETGEQEALTRMISTNLRHGTPVDFIVEQLNKSYGTIADFNKAITRALKKYMKEKELGIRCPICGEKVVYIEGCEQCKDCGWAKCG